MRVPVAVPVTVVVTLLVGSGGAYAASKITGAQIKDGTITSADVKNRSLARADLSGGAMSALRGAAGPAGPQGPAGPAGLSAITRVSGATVSQGAFGSGVEVQTSTATCPAGTYVSGGGYRTGSIDDIVGYAISSPTQYSVIGVNEFSQAGSITAQAVCAGGTGVVASRVRSSRTPAAIVRRAAALQAKIDAARTSHVHGVALASKRCSAGYVRGTIGGETKCLRAGEFCAARYKRQYNRYGYSCVAGRLRYS